MNGGGPGHGRDKLGGMKSGAIHGWQGRPWVAGPPPRAILGPYMGKTHRSLKNARAERGWSLYAAAKAMEGVSNQQLQNLEDGVTAPGAVRASTMIEILRIYD